MRIATGTNTTRSPPIQMADHRRSPPRLVVGMVWVARSVGRATFPNASTRAQLAQIGQVAQALSGVGIGEPSIDQEAGKIRIPVGSDGPAALLDSVRRIDDMKLALEDIALHRPTLDDVFLSLTGHAAEEEQEEQASSGRRKRGQRRGRRRDT